MRVKSFNRYELKYLLTTDQHQELIPVLADYLEPDAHGQGSYTVTSLYYDSPDYKAYWDKIEGHKFRRKVRIRTYGEQPVTPKTDCFVEIKQRINKTVQKKRVVLPYGIATDLCGAGQTVSTDSRFDQAVIDEILYLHDTLHLQPACIVRYCRQAFNGHEYDPGLRITFDTQLKGRTHHLTLLTQKEAENHFFIPPEWCIMEIKVNYRVPYWLTEIIGQHRCTLRRISKYCATLEQTKALLQTQQINYYEKG